MVGALSELISKRGKLKVLHIIPRASTGERGRLREIGQAVLRNRQVRKKSESMLHGSTNFCSMGVLLSVISWRLLRFLPLRV